MTLGAIVSDGEQAVGIFSKVSKFIGGWQFYAAIAAVMFGIGFGAAWKIQNGIAAEKSVAQQQAVIDAVTKAVAGQKAQDAITQAAAVASAVKQQKIVTVTVQTIKKVPVYVTPEIDARFPLPWGFVRVYDASVGGISVADVPLPAGKSDGDPSGIKTSVAAADIAENNGTCLAIRQQLIDLQGWVRAQQALAKKGRT